MVALKVLSPTLSSDTETLNTFLNEGYLCSRIAHPNIVRVFRVGSAEGLYYMVMELVDGGSARKLIDGAKGKLPERRALEITAQVASGLAAAHANKLVHRDVKPENILLTSQGAAKLADLGLALKIGSSDGDGGEFSGTPGYVAPEVITGQAPPSPASDLFGLGATLYDLMTGYPPFMGNSPEEMLRQTLQAPAPSVRSLRPECSQNTENMIFRLLLKDPGLRPASAQQVADDLYKSIHLMSGHNAMAAQLGVPIKMPTGLPISAKPQKVTATAIPQAPAPAAPPARPVQSVPPPIKRVQWKDPLAARSNTGAAKRPSTGAFLAAQEKAKEESKKKIPTRPAHQNPKRKPNQ
jgi:serine/threonine-protein kinase